MGKSLLLASFVKPEQLDVALEKISRVAGISLSDIFVFKSEDCQDYILTYNVGKENGNLKFGSLWKDTISIHRKKDTNTLFSLNALNEVIRRENGGRMVAGYEIDWDKYANSFLLFRSGKLSVLPITLVRVNR